MIRNEFGLRKSRNNELKGVMYVTVSLLFWQATTLSFTDGNTRGLSNLIVLRVLRTTIYLWPCSKELLCQTKWSKEKTCTHQRLLNWDH